MADVLETIIRASERAACVARSCCTGTPNELLFISEKCEGEANARFDKDFKTIADVLAQEAARYEIASRCPDLAKYIRGEECAEIGGVCITLKGTAEETTELLSSLMPLVSAERMSEAAHRDVHVTLEDELPTHIPNLNSADLGVWIDPIDATAEFIAGVKGEADADCGLPCVTVLIGAYERSTGEPIVGVINQPFYNNGKGRIIWGVSYGDTKVCGGCNMNNDSSCKTVLMSAAESPEIREKFQNSGWEVKSVPGAGNKLMKVALGEAALYIVSKGTTFRWDTCAPHAILRAKGGDMLCYKTHNLIRYNDPINAETQLYSNAGGIIAYSEPTVLEQIQSILN